MEQKKNNSKSIKRNIDIISVNKVINSNLVKNNHIKNITTNIISNNDKKRNKINLSDNFIKEDKIEKIENTMKYIEEEKNLLDYNLALQYDKRSYFTYYISLLKNKT